MQLGAINTNLIVALHALLSHRNVTRAAKDVGLGQSSMSHALSKLRTHFGDPLLVPAGRELVLTERAKALVGLVADAVGRLERVFTQPEPFDPKTSSRTFRVAATDNLELYVLPRLAAMLQKSAPRIDVRVCALPEDWRLALIRGDVDLKLGRKHAAQASLESEILSREEFACVVRRRHPVSSRPTLQQYARLEHVLVAPTGPPETRPSSFVDAHLAKQGLSRRVVMTVPHFLVAPFIVQSSDLALTAPARLLRPFIESLELRAQPNVGCPRSGRRSAPLAARSRSSVFLGSK
jgi:DNA-binding transcriptional LysR family regulator